MILQFKTSIPPTSNQRLMPVRMGQQMRLVKSPAYRKWMESTVRDVALQAYDTLQSRHEVYQCLNAVKQQALQTQCPGAASVVQDIAMEFKADCKPLSDELYIVVTVCPPDKRKRDIDNVLKPINDVLVQARVIEDDCKIAMELACKLPPNRNKRQGEVQVFVFDKNQAVDLTHHPCDDGLSVPEAQSLEPSLSALLTSLSNMASPSQRVHHWANKLEAILAYPQKPSSTNAAFSRYVTESVMPACSVSWRKAMRSCVH